MKNKLLLFSVAALLASCTDDSFVNEVDNSLSMQDPATRAIHFDKASQTSEVLVKFKEKYVSTVESTVSSTRAASAMSRSGVENFDNFLSETEAVSFKRVFPITKFEKRTRISGLHLWYKVKFSQSFSTASLKQRLLQIPELSSIELVLPIHNIDGKQEQPEFIQNLNSTTGELPVNDPFLKKQWHYNNDGTVLSMSKPQADINLFKAWKRTTGDPSVTVAVVDEFVQYAHPDLKENMWVNEKELNGKPGVDDDNNGYVDDIYGYHFIENKADGTPGGHGTHVAGTVAATNNNNIGVAGIAGGSGKGDGVRIMTCGALGKNGGTVEAAALSLQYATDNGAVIAQNSWGYDNPTIPWEEHNDFSMEREALQYFIDNAGKDENGKVVGPMDGGVVIFAAGNDGHAYGSQPFWPAAHPDFIAVSSIGCDYNPAYYTCYGSWVDIAAPGGDQVFNGDTAGVLSTCIGNSPSESGYAFYQGTSMACPHVSGVASLVVSYAKENNLTLTNTQLKEILLSSGRNIDSYFTGEKNFPGNPKFPAFYLNMADYKGLMGNGLIDASLALDRVDQLIGKPSDHVAPSPIESVTSVSDGPEAIKISWNISADYQSNPLQTYSVYFSTAEIQVANGKLVQDKNLQGPVMYAVKEGAKVGDSMEALINGLQVATKYNLAIVGYDQWRSASTPKLFTGNTGPIPAGYPVENLKATDVSVNSFNVEWNETSDYLKRPYKVYHVLCSANKDFSDAKKNILLSTGKIGRKLSTQFKDLKADVLYYIKVFAYDKDNLASQPAVIECKTLANSLPVITPVFKTPVNLQYWETKEFKLKVVDPDYDSWTASLQEEKEGWSLKSDKQYVTLTFAGPVTTSGTDKLGIKVVDEKGGEATYQFSYEIVANVAPELEGAIADLYLEGNSSKQTIKLNEYFTDANKEVLTYTVKSSNSNVNAVVTDENLVIEGLKSGSSKITVIASDKQSKSVETSFNVMVRQSTADMELYPNPVKDVMYVRFGKKVSGPIKVKVLRFNGSPIFETDAQVSPFAPAKIDMKNVKPGNLLIQVESQGKIFKGNVVKL